LVAFPIIQVYQIVGVKKTHHSPNFGVKHGKTQTLLNPHKKVSKKFPKITQNQPRISQKFPPWAVGHIFKGAPGRLFVLRDVLAPPSSR